MTRCDTPAHALATQDELGFLRAISLQEAAKRLDLDVRSLYRMEKRGELRLVRYCTRTRVPISELERLIAPPTREEQRLTYHEARQADTPEV